MTIRRKQAAGSHEEFLWLLDHIEAVISERAVMVKAERTAERMVLRVKTRHAAFGWSGGKDSLALAGLCQMVGIAPCVMVITAGLEYPEFLRWVTENMPPALTVVKTPQDIDWLVANPGMLFPQKASIAAKWFRIVQNDGQERYYQRHGLDLLLTGRRRKDGNMVGPKGQDIYTNGRGVTRYSPMADWSHEEVIGFNYYRGHPCPPTYTWPNGFRVGTGAWPARQYTGSIQNGWREVYAIDSQIVRDAAMRFRSAAMALAELEPAVPVPR